jgi:hypothetical protein
MGYRDFAGDWKRWLLKYFKKNNVGNIKRAG